MSNVDHDSFRRGAEFYSIFGQIEEVVAEEMIKEGKAKKIPSEQIPDSARFNERGTHAKFAVFMPRQMVAEFETRIAQLRA